MDPLSLTVADLGAMLEACHYQAAVRLALPAPCLLQVDLIGATTSRLLGLTTPDEPGTLWLLGGTHIVPMPAMAWKPQHRLRP